MPPGPVSVTSRISGRRSKATTAALSRSRPMKGVGGAASRPADSTMASGVVAPVALDMAGRLHDRRQARQDARRGGTVAASWLLWGVPSIAGVTILISVAEGGYAVGNSSA